MEVLGKVRRGEERVDGGLCKITRHVSWVL